MAVVRVFVRCPRCGEEWHQATLDTCTWWGEGLTVEQIAAQCYCRACHKAPPMIVVSRDAPNQLTLF